MIIWINGAFGAGKTQAAYELCRRLPDSYVYDPENVGYFIRKNLPPVLCEGDFQDYPMWRGMNLAMLDYLVDRYAGDIIVPMTVTSRDYYDEIIGVLSQRHALVHVILCARRETLLKRLRSRLETGRSWAAQQIDRCIRAFAEEIPGHRIHTDDRSIEQVVEQIALLAGVTLRADHRGRVRRLFHRVVTQCRHIRQAGLPPAPISADGNNFPRS